MSFILTIHDRSGTELQFGDIVKVHNDDKVQFYAEVTWMESEQAIAPFHTFTFHSFEKIDKLPYGVMKSTEERYNVWYIESPEEDTERFEGYLMSWRECEYQLKKKCFRIKPNKQLNLFK